ncbi:MAG: hypothetical protein K2N01_10695 [Lachnospiraceae bacterium]|nr:hypothetical protein [Lachnospiraceae bacterium]
MKDTTVNGSDFFDLDAYETVLADWVAKQPQEKEVAGFALIYLDNDEIPELAIIEGWAHASGVSIYTYEKGEAVFVGKYGQYGAMGYRQKEGIVFDDYDQGGNVFSQVYQIDKSNVTLLTSYSVYYQFMETEEPEIIYTVDGQEVSQKQYQEVSERWGTAGMKVIDYGMCIPITEMNIRQSLEDQLEALILTETLPEIPTVEHGILEIYAGRDVISVSGDTMIAQVSPQEILMGNPILYDRFRTDGWIFEWLVSDYFDDNNWFFEDGVLVVSRENDTENAQIIHVTAEGGYATWVSAENRFEYMDVNFDDIPDLLICTGHRGNQGALTYYCFLQTENGFVESPTFTDIPNPSIDADNKLILSQWRNSALSHSWAEFKYQDNVYVMYRELCEEAVPDSAKDIWVWTVNNEEIGRSDELTMEEIEDLLYNENSEWRISEDRWRTI